MRKVIYIILAVLIASGITVIQVMIARSASAGKSYEMFMAAEDLEAGTVLTEAHLEEVVLSAGRDAVLPGKTDKNNLIGKTVAQDIPGGRILTEACVIETSATDGGNGYLALKVNGGNFNADNLKRGDTVDIYFLPDYGKLEDYQVVWLNDILAGYSGFIKGKHPGILIEDLLIDHIEKTAGDQAEYVSIKAPRKVDEAIAFLEQISIYEFIGR